MADTATAPANERPASLTNLRLQIDELRERAEHVDTVLGQVVELTELKRTLDSALKATKDKLDPRHEQLLEEFAGEGVSSKRHAETGKLVYVNRRVWARPADGHTKDTTADLLEAAGLGDYVERGWNTTSLSAYFNEQVKTREADGQPVTNLDQLLPDQLRGAIALTEDHKIGVRS